MSNTKRIKSDYKPALNSAVNCTTRNKYLTDLCDVPINPVFCSPRKIHIESIDSTMAQVKGKK